MGAALVLETAAAMPDRRKFSLNPSFALVLFVFAIVAEVGGWWCWNVWFVRFQSGYQWSMTRWWSQGERKMRIVGLCCVDLLCCSLQWTLATAETWSVPPLLILGILGDALWLAAHPVMPRSLLNGVIFIHSYTLFHCSCNPWTMISNITEPFWNKDGFK